MKFEILRIGQRLVRDDRVTTHVALVSRAFGASKIYMNEVNPEIKDTLEKINLTWGGDFEIEFIDNWKKDGSRPAAPRRSIRCARCGLTSPSRSTRPRFLPPHRLQIADSNCDQDGNELRTIGRELTRRLRNGFFDSTSFRSCVAFHD